MIHSAIKTYLHSSPISENEVNLIKELLKDGGERLEDFLPKDEKLSSWFLSRLLDASLKDYKNNKEFIDSIISLKNDKNKDSLYYHLKNHKYGLELIKNNPILFDDDINKAFNDLLSRGSSKPILEFVKDNKEKIDAENIYKHHLDISLIPALEKLGLIFDDRIVNVVANEKNYRKPDKILTYLEKFEPTCNEKIWNNAILGMLCYYNRQIWDDYGKNKIGDSFSLITKLKNPSQYKWGQELNNWQFFSFNDSLRALLNNRRLGRYIDDNKPTGIDSVKEFIKENDIYFTNLKNYILFFSAFINDLSDAVFDKTLKDNWSEMFDFKEMEDVRRERNKGLHRDTAIFHDLRKENSILQNERFRRFALKEYFSNKKYRLRDYNESTFFAALGLGKSEIIHNNAFSKYSDILEQRDVKYILDSLHLSKKEREVALMSYEMRKPDDFTNPTVRKLKL